MLLLDAYNRLLQAAGELKVDEIDDTHPMHLQIVDALRTKSTSIQARGWWFNKYTITLTPDGAGNVTIPPGLLSFDGQMHYGYDKVILKGNTLIYQRDRTPVVGVSVKASLIEEWEFTTLPQTAAEFVLIDACLTVAESFDADPTKLQTLAARRQEAFAAFHAEHVRQSNVNMLENHSMNHKMHRAMQHPRIK